MRPQNSAREDQTYAERGWRIAPAGEILDPCGGMVAGDVRTRMQSLEMRRLLTDRFNRIPAVDYNSGADCVRRFTEAETAQAEHVRIFGR